MFLIKADVNWFIPFSSIIVTKKKKRVQTISRCVITKCRNLIFKMWLEIINFYLLIDLNKIDVSELCGMEVYYANRFIVALIE